MNLPFLLDTDVLSETTKKYPNAKVISFLETAENLLLPAAALMELHKGIMLIVGENPIKAVQLSNWYNKLTAEGQIPIIPTGREVLDIWSTLAADRRLQNLIILNGKSKRHKYGQDLHIAAAALAERAAIATFNVKDYMTINECYPLPGIYHPREDVWYAKMEPLNFPNAHGYEGEFSSPRIMTPAR